MLLLPEAAMEFRRSSLVARGSEGKNKKCGAEPRRYATGVQTAGKSQAATAANRFRIFYLDYLNLKKRIPRTYPKTSIFGLI
jgi:hypothetical protein